jgi:hypothetical protein
MATQAQVLAEIERRKGTKEVGAEDIKAEIVRRGLDQPSNLPEGNPIDSLLEPAATITTGMASSVAGGLAGLVDSLNPTKPAIAGAQR